MCGGTIEFKPGSTVGECEHCGTKQTLVAQQKVGILANGGFVRLDVVRQLHVSCLVVVEHLLVVV